MSIASSFTEAKGAGSAGASTAYHLRKVRSPCLGVKITVFEKEPYVGGRSTTVDAHGNSSQPLELGASIFVEVNEILFSAARAFGLPLVGAGSRRPRETSKSFGVWDGSDFRFIADDSDSWWYELGKLIWRYGLAPLRTQRLMKKSISTFLKIYQAPIFPFASLSQAAEELGLTDLTAESGAELLESKGIRRTFSQDIIQASTRVNYAQNLTQIHGLETMVCMATDGAMAIQNGNYHIFENMLRVSDASLLLNTTVTAVIRNDDNTISIASRNTESWGDSNTSDDRTEVYDEVVLAAPLQFTGIDFQPHSLKMRLPEKIDYVNLFVTLLSSPHRLASSYFGLDPLDVVPETILTTISTKNSIEPPFFSVSTLQKVTNPQLAGQEYAYKIFSSSPVSSSLLSQLFGFPDPECSLEEIPRVHVSWLYEKTWKSYPYLHPRRTFEGPLLDDHIYSTAGIESFISTMETSALSGKNVAKLIVDGWTNKQSIPEAVVHTEI